jgi:general secretion pathway protein A
MYDAFYHLQGKPFQMSPDPRFFYSSRGHRRAMAYLLYGAHQGEGFIVITGEIGAGKTMLASTLAQRLASRNLVLAQVVSTRLDADDMIRMVAGAFGLPQEGSKAVLLNAVHQFLLECQSRQQRALLVVDEAQNLPPASVEELRMLSNFLHDARPLLQIFLLGQPEFRRILQGPGMEQLRQRVTASCHLGPMSGEETRAYIVHRLQTVGWHGDPSIAEDAFAGIHHFSGGVPRKINALCDRLLLMGCLDQKHSVAGRDVVAVIEELRHELVPADAPAAQERGGG